jgi:hypothetical protein
MGLIKVGITFEREVPDFSRTAMDPLIREIADKIKNDAQKNIRTETQVDGTKMQALAKKTIANKRANRSSTPTKPLIDKGILFNSIHVFKQATASYITGIKALGRPPRDLIGYYQQEEGVNNITRVARRFLGVSRETEKWIEERTQRYINALMKKGVKTKKKINGG